jgi:hypothetical protein
MPTTESRPVLPETRTTGVRPRGSQVRVRCGRRAWPASSSKQISLHGLPPGPFEPSAACLSGAPPLVHRLRAHPQRPGDLPSIGVPREHLCGSLQPHPLPAGPALRGQPATIRIPHDTGLDPPSPPGTQACRP